ncbi:hypothetical protein Pmar_PMAR028657 [Perkinsus marinus ATCC 50983]|uniref:Uncharacterized protein n=1 Tax=Perkinsus marinus (strain ATCC 50983 / TXsc) TaxID=423536 RepID=C5K8I5_PERM5|nr:hypothetical protein Pmar_PMAR028657 [Perkinsus marinus ATCC 50983]EER19192.1 hypothetical protein Pmar_PMAR028657 [Perkinsus marinus ATCC 50983]|eukprot:XP_002787396.1 hypothetical protein Pmar_PMAR028657 [Perkinsus marinus ATCC 50983]
MSPSRATLEFEAELATVLEESKATFEEEERKRQRRLLPERKACGLPKESKMLTRSLTQTFTELGRENANPRRQSRIVKDAEISLMALVVKRRERRKSVNLGLF